MISAKNKTYQNGIIDIRNNYGLMSYDDTDIFLFTNLSLCLKEEFSAKEFNEIIDELLKDLNDGTVKYEKVNRYFHECRIRRYIRGHGDHFDEWSYENYGKEYGYCQ